MRKLSKWLLVALVFCLTVCAPTAVLAAGETPADGISNVVEKQGEDGTLPDFATIIGDTGQQVEAVPAAGKEMTGWGVFYIVAIPVGVLATGACVYFLFFHGRKRRRENPGAKTYGLLYRSLASAFAFLLICGTGILGTAGLLEDVNQPNYWFGGAYRSVSAAPDPVAGYTESMTSRKILSTFEFGMEGAYDRVNYSLPHFWNKSEPTYNYSIIELPYKKASMYEIGGTENEDDNFNYWYVLPPDDSSDKGENYYCDAEYRLSMRAKDNYEDTRPYDKLRVVFRGENPNGDVNLTVIADTRREEALELDDAEPIRYTLGTYQGKSGQKLELSFNLSNIAAEDRPYLSRLIFRTTNESLGSDRSGGSYQKNEIYYLEMYSTGETVRMRTELTASKAQNAGVRLQMDSEYLGSLGYTLYGAYSANGFYDSSDGKWKLWFGCGIPENIASDNVYYTETVDPNLGWSTPVRLILNDPEEKLFAPGISPGYGGDPCVIKVDGTYYMYFSGLERYTAHPPNKIYLATSKDGVNFTVYGAVVDVPKLGLGYGAGSPSVIYKDGKYYLYYYTQSPSNDYPNEPIGFVLKVGDDPYHFGEATALPGTYGAGDVRWVPSLGLWVVCDYTEGAGQGGYAYDMIRVGFSRDGINFEFGSQPWTRPAQDYSAKTNHNPGWIGNEYGHGFETMFLTYGVNDIPLRDTAAGMQMDTRQLGWSRVTLTLLTGGED